MPANSIYVSALHRTEKLLSESFGSLGAAVAATVSLFGLKAFSMNRILATDNHAIAVSQVWTALLRTPDLSGKDVDEHFENLAEELDMPELAATAVFGSLERDILQAVVSDLDQLDAPATAEADFAPEHTEQLAVSKALEQFIDDLSRRRDYIAFTTPETHNKLIAGLLLSGKRTAIESIYDPACGMGGTLVTLFNALKTRFRHIDVQFTGMDVDANMVIITAWRLLLHGGRKFVIEVGDVLHESNFMRRQDEKRFDLVVSVPPLHPTAATGLRNFRSLTGSSRISVGGRRADYIFVQHALNSRAGHGRAAVTIALSALNRTGQDEVVRRNLTRAFDIESVVSLPAESSVRSDAAILIADYDTIFRASDAIFFLKEVQTPGLRGRNELAVDEMLEIYKKHRDLPGKSALAALKTIEDNNFSLVPHLYITPEAIQLQGERTISAQIHLREKDLKATAKRLADALERTRTNP